MHRTRPTVSLIMMVRDEQHNLADCLTPVAPLMDEIVIVDTGSRDATKQIASRFTSHVFDFPWSDDFSAARNESLRRSTGDWVFWLDADDRVSPANVAHLNTLIEQLDDRSRCFFMNTASRRRFACDYVQLHSHPRLFRRHADVQWRGRVHEQLRPEPAHLGYETVWTDIQIDHLGYQSPADVQRKQRRNLRLLAMDYAVDPRDISTLFHLGLTHADLGNKVEARKFLHQILLSDQRLLPYVRRVYYTLADLSIREGNTQEALAIVAQGLSYFPHDHALLYQKADILGMLDRFAEAEQILLEIVHSPESPQHDGGPGEIRNRLVPRKIAEHLASQGRFAEAIQVINVLLAETPDDTRSWYLLGSIFIGADNRSDLDTICERLKSCPQGDYFSRILLAGWHLWRKQIAPAIELIDWLIAALPDAPLPRSLRCQALALQNAPPAARIRACRDLLRVEPGNASAARELQLLENADRAVAYSTDSAWHTSVVCGPGIAVG